MNPFPFRPRLLAAACLLLLPLLVFHRALFLGDAFLPSDTLKHVAPWKATAGAPLPWNVLRFDGITQFYPWRLQVSRAWRHGTIPVTNPYAFAADGGTPLLANSQSAPFYPPNLIFVALGERLLWYGFGLSAALHLLLLAAGTYRLARRLDRSRAASLLAATTISLSGPVVCWLALPTFLCAAAWLPWLLLALHRAHQPDGRRAQVAAAGLIGLILLSGHLQIALYALLAAGAYALSRSRVERVPPLRWLGAAAVVTLLGAALALPQVLPAVALSKQSHRASASRPTVTDYTAWSANAVPAQSLLTFVSPDFFGHPNRNSGFYWNTNWRPDGRPSLNNYGEWALYIGVVPLLLALLGMTLRTSRFFTGLAVVTLLMAFGTGVNLPFYFLVPGWSQTGNPGRILVVSALALSLLAAFGLDALADATPRQRAAAATGVLVLLVAGLGLALRQANALPIPWGDALSQAQPLLVISLVWLALGTVGLFAARHRPGIRLLLVALAVVDLAYWGWGYNPTLPARDVYPVTPGIAWLQTHAKDALIAPLNDRWSTTGDSPEHAALPPNALTVYGLHDLAGYDSLFRARAKRPITAATGSDPAPPENGNMVFIKTVEAARALGAKYIVVAPDRTLETALPVVYEGPDLRIYENPEGQNAPPTDNSPPPELSTGLLAAALSLMVLAFGLIRRRSPSPTLRTP